MVASPRAQFVPPEEYLAWEEKQDERYEYVDGDILAMTGGTLPHNDLAINLLFALRSHVTKRGCRVNIADAKVQVAENGPYFYPDLVVSCDRRDREAQKFICYPTLVVEVLSPGTESKDWGKKFRQYQQSETLQEYVLVDYASVRVECFRHGKADRIWIYEAFETGDIVRLESLEFECPIATIYEGVMLLAQVEDEHD